MTGGCGSDVFVLAAGEGTDTMADFKKGTDLIGLSGGLSFDKLSFSSNKVKFWLPYSELLSVMSEDA